MDHSNKKTPKIETHHPEQNVQQIDAKEGHQHERYVRQHVHRVWYAAAQAPLIGKAVV
jgi:hypothetical protein